MAFGQQFSEDLDPFNKLVVDPYIEIELVKGDKEQIEVFYDNIDPDEIFAEQQGKTLRVYLADAKVGFSLFADDNFRKKKYRYSSVRMVITYKTLKNIQFRGEEKLTCNDELSGSRIKLKAYGQTKIRIASVDTRKFKVALYGENEMKISSGNTYNQIVNTYGENTIEASNLISYGVKTNSFGENRISVNATDYLRILHIGEGRLSYAGQPTVERNWTIGEVDIRRLR